MKINRRHFCSGLAIGATAAAPSTASGQSEYTRNIQLIEADSDAGFNYPYFLYTPSSLPTNAESPRPILVSIVNTIVGDNDFTTFLQLAKREIKRGRKRTVADGADIPLLIPVVPRPNGDPEPSHFYPTFLTPDTFTNPDSPLSRVDLQVLAMIEDASSRLEDDGYNIASKIHLDGFSSDGIFANRFTMLHPERVNAASYGGIKQLTLPKTQVDSDIPVEDNPEWDKMSYPAGTDEKELPYPIGVANLEELTGNTFNREAWLNTPQYIYIGDEDNPAPGDGQEYRTFWNLYDEQAQQTPPSGRSYALPDLIDDIYGEMSFDERWKVSRAVYENVGAATEFTVYEGYGHTWEPAVNDLIEFHRTEIEETYGSISPVEKGISTVEKNPVFTIGATLTGILGIGYILKLRSEVDS